MMEIASAGVLVFRQIPEKSFLLLRAGKRWDVPKGHVRKGESETAAALRELREETGISPERVMLDAGFRFTTELKFKAAYLGGRFVHKTYVVFIGCLDGDAEVKLSDEHTIYQWFAWQPPHRLQKWLIDPLLEEVCRYFALREIQDT